VKVRRLRLQNYRRHRDTELELPEGVVAVLGRNGSGKSSLLEAIAFALFGPSALRTGKDLLRHAAAAPTDAVRVELDLELGGQALQLVRKLRGKALTPNASLHVDGVVLVPPGAGSSEAATTEIEGRLGMDRDAFFTTIVAQQGELSRLADARPADRKRLLLRMLGIDRVENAIARGRVERNVAQQTLENLRALAPDLAVLEAEGKARQDELAQAVRNVESTQRLAQEARQASEAAEKAFAVQEAAYQEERLRAQRLVALRTEEESRSREVQRLTVELQRARDAERQCQALEALAAQVETRDEALRVATLQEAARGQHLERLRYVEQQRKSVEVLRRQLEGLVVPDGAEAVLAQGRTTLSASQESLHAAERELAVLKARWDDLESRRTTLASLGPQAPCPTCERPLDGQFEHLHQSVVEAAGGLQSRVKETEHRVGALKLNCVELQARVTALERRARDAETLSARRADLQRRIVAEAERLAQAEATLGAEPPPPVDLKAMRAAALEARQAREQRLRLEALAARVPALVQDVERAQSALDAARLAREAFPPSTFDEALLLEARAAKSQAAERAKKADREAVEAQVAVESRKAAVREAERRLEEAKQAHARIGVLEKELQDWTALVGRTGGGLLDRFRDHLVSRVGPAIQAEASRLMSRFTGGRYSEVLLDEDYEVYVTDQGARYTLERFSGGEKDLVHLALRLAVSRLIADRGGVELRFLALDEVFGSLDQERRELVVAALGELGTLYSQVLVVSHLESLQDALQHALVVEGEDEASLRLEARSH
jgi:DNA repair protein SbcC/Rad50